MQFIIELDGPIFDVAAAYYRAYTDVVGELGWSRLDHATFRRRLRKDGPRANLLPGARPGKIEAYHRRFQECIDADDVVALYEPQPDIADNLASLGRQGGVAAVTLGANADARRRAIAHAGLEKLLTRFETLDPDPRRRPGALRVLAGDEGQSVVAASTDAVLRAAGLADLVAVGLTCGMCSSARLFQAGAAVVYQDLGALEQAIRDRAEQLIRAGLLPW